MKRLISAILCAFVLSTPVCADSTTDTVTSYIDNMNAPSQFSDMAEAQWAAESIQFLTKCGVINGFEDGTFRPNGNITRAEFVKIVVSAFGLYNDDAHVMLIDNTPDYWYYPFVSSALELGIVRPRADSFFDADTEITREEMFDITKKAMDISEISLIDNSTSITFTDEDMIAPKYRQSIDYMVAGGMIAGNPDGTLCPKSNSTRAEACVMLTRVLDSALENEMNKFNNINATNTEDSNK